MGKTVFDLSYSSILDKRTAFGCLSKFGVSGDR